MTLPASNSRQPSPVLDTVETPVQGCIGDAPTSTHSCGSASTDTGPGDTDELTDLVAVSEAVSCARAREPDTGSANSDGEPGSRACRSLPPPSPEQGGVQSMKDVEGLYAQAKRGSWGGLLEAWRNDPELASVCAHRSRSTSGWTFLHQAAYFGNEAACRALIRAGASLFSVTRDGKTPEQVARDRGHGHVAEVLDHASRGLERSWAAPSQVGVLPSSCFWSEAQPRKATRDLVVAYGGALAHVRAGKTYYVDSFGRVLVGWHGTTTPPAGMDDYPIVGIAERRDPEQRS